MTSLPPYEMLLGDDEAAFRGLWGRLRSLLSACLTCSYALTKLLRGGEAHGEEGKPPSCKQITG